MQIWWPQRDRPTCDLYKRIVHYFTMSIQKEQAVYGYYNGVFRQEKIVNGQIKKTKSQSGEKMRTK